MPKMGSLPRATYHPYVRTGTRMEKRLNTAGATEGTKKDLSVLR